MEDLYLRKQRKRRRFSDRLKFCKSKKVLLCLLILVPILLYVLFNNKGVVQRMKLEARKDAMEQKVREAETEGHRLRTEVKALESDPAAVEKVAREKHGMVREGEKVYRVQGTH